MTESISIYASLSAVMDEVREVKKGDRNSSQGYAFRGIDAVVNAVGPILRKHKVVITPEVLTINYRDVTTSGGKPSRECTVTVRYRFYGPSGDFIDCVTPGESLDFGDKGAPKAMSVAFRIALLQALCLPTDDPDPDSHSYEREQQPAIGRGQAPAAPKNKFGGTDPNEIRNRLRADCEKMGWDLNVVGGLFELENGSTLKVCTDASKINEFWRGLAARSDKELTAQPETVGAK